MSILLDSGLMEPASLERLAKRIWMKLFVKIEKTVYGDDYQRLQKAYAIPDPWNMGSTRECDRFEAMNRLILAHCGHPGSILEIGSGEGHHTQYLARIADEIVGVEVSEKAIERARRRCPQAIFIQAHFPQLPLDLRPRYDLVMASEVLYYMRDLPGAIAAMNWYGRYCMVSCYEREIDHVERHFKSLPLILREDILVESWLYRIYLWRSEHPQGNS